MNPCCTNEAAQICANCGTATVAGLSFSVTGLIVIAAGFALAAAMAWSLSGSIWRLASRRTVRAIA